MQKYSALQRSVGAAEQGRQHASSGKESWDLGSRASSAVLRCRETLGKSWHLCLSFRH